MDFPIKNCDFPYSYVSLPEGIDQKTVACSLVSLLGGCRACSGHCRCSGLSGHWPVIVKPCWTRVIGNWGTIPIYIYIHTWLWCSDWWIMLIQHLSWLRLTQEPKDAEIIWISGLSSRVNVTAAPECLRSCRAWILRCNETTWSCVLHSLLAGLSAVSVRFVPLATQSEVGHGMEMDGSSRVQQSPCTDWTIFDFCPVD